MTVPRFTPASLSTRRSMFTVESSMFAASRLPSRPQRYLPEEQFSGPIRETRDKQNFLLCMHHPTRMTPTSSTYVLRLPPSLLSTTSSDRICGNSSHLIPLFYRH